MFSFRWSGVIIFQNVLSVKAPVPKRTWWMTHVFPSDQPCVYNAVTTHTYLWIWILVTAPTLFIPESNLGFICIRSMKKMHKINAKLKRSCWVLYLRTYTTNFAWILYWVNTKKWGENLGLFRIGQALFLYYMTMNWN
jgi:hypothetical protein